MTNVRLHERLGVNARVETCSRCGAETGNILLLGDANYRSRCDACDVAVIDRHERGTCPNCKRRCRALGELGDSERVVSGVCDACAERQRACDEVVRAGGVYWRCSACGSAGAIRDSDLARAVRADADAAPPKPCGIEFDAATCPACTTKENER